MEVAGDGKARVTGEGRETEKGRIVRVRERRAGVASGGTVAWPWRRVADDGRLDKDAQEIASDRRVEEPMWCRQDTGNSADDARRRSGEQRPTIKLGGQHVVQCPANVV